MKIVIQRCQQASVSVAGEVVGKIDNGLTLLVAIFAEDTLEKTQQVVDKILKLRIFSDSNGKMNLNVKEAQGELLIISQFTLAADLTQGNRPSFQKAADPKKAKKIYQYMVEYATETHKKVAQGQFATEMKVNLVNDGPATFIIEA